MVRLYVLFFDISFHSIFRSYSKYCNFLSLRDGPSD